MNPPKSSAKHTILKAALKLTLYTFALLAVLSFGQFAQYLYSYDDMRAMTLNNWAKEDSARKAQVANFKRMCLVNPHSADLVLKDRPIKPVEPISDCARKYGHDDIADLMVQPGNRTMSLAWPLSILGPSITWEQTNEPLQRLTQKEMKTSKTEYYPLNQDNHINRSFECFKDAQSNQDTLLISYSYHDGIMMTAFSRRSAYKEPGDISCDTEIYIGGKLMTQQQAEEMYQDAMPKQAPAPASSGAGIPTYDLSAQ